MKRLLPIVLLGCMLAPAAENGGGVLPEPPTPEQVQQMPPQERTAAATAIKRVMFRRFLRLREERHRLTQENTAETAALAEQLKAPAVFCTLLKLEAAAPLSGRDLYDYRQILNKTLAAYGVDALQIRLFVEDISCPPARLQAIVDTLPVEAVFNLLPRQQIDDRELESQIVLLVNTYARLVQLYKDIANREQADAAALELHGLLQEYSATAPLRMLLTERRNPRMQAIYEEVGLAARRALNQERTRLQECAYYGSYALAVLDYLLN